MAGFGVSVARLESTASDVRAKNGMMKSALDSATDNVNRLLGIWSGDAAQQASQAANNMANLFNEFNQEVEKFAKFLDDAAINWAKAEGANTGNETNNASQFRS